MDPAAIVRLGPSRREGGLHRLLHTPVGWAPVAVGLTAFDAIATAMSVGLGIALEGNPWLAWLIDEAGLASAMLARALIGVVFVLLLDALRPVSATARRALPAVTTVLAAVAAWHLIGPVLMGP